MIVCTCFTYLQVHTRIIFNCFYEWYHCAKNIILWTKYHFTKNWSTEGFSQILCFVSYVFTACAARLLYVWFELAVKIISFVITLHWSTPRRGLPFQSTSIIPDTLPLLINVPHFNIFRGFYDGPLLQMFVIVIIGRAAYMVFVLT